MLFLSACNAGHLDQENIAKAFTDVIGMGGRVIAADGVIRMTNRSAFFNLIRRGHTMGVHSHFSFNNFRPYGSDRTPLGLIAFYRDNGVISHQAMTGFGYSFTHSHTNLTPRQFTSNMFNSSRNFYNR